MKCKMKRKHVMAVVLLAAFMFIVTLCPAVVFAAGNIPVTVDIRVTYNVDGNAGTAGGDRFTLTADDPGAPMPEGAVGGKRTITIPKEGSYSFGDILFERPEESWYTITREAAYKKGVVKDNTIYRAKVIALNDGHGYVLVYRNGSNEKQELKYMDRVTPATGDNNKIIIYSCAAVAAAAMLVLCAAALKRSKRKGVQSETEKNDY